MGKGILTERKDSNQGSSVLTIKKRSKTIVTTASSSASVVSATAKITTVKSSTTATATATATRAITLPPNISFKPVTTHRVNNDNGFNGRTTIMAGQIGFSQLGNSTKNKNNNSKNDTSEKNSLKPPRKLWTLQGMYKRKYFYCKLVFLNVVYFMLSTVYVVDCLYSSTCYATRVGKAQEGVPISEEAHR